MSIKPILSVGIDVGTTSTHLTINRLFLSNVSRAGEPERVVISRRENFYQSPVRLTPLCDDGSIDADAISSFLEQHYDLAHVQSSDIASGAIIITGETAKIRNAESVAERVSSLAGQFVVASAGPNFESVLAGRGSGAAEYSKIEHKVVCNVDIGGGTTNIAIFKNGAVMSTAAIALGGRLVCLNEDMKIQKFSESGRIAAEHSGTTIALGQVMSLHSANQITAHVAACIVDMITSENYSHPLLITSQLVTDNPIDEFWFSGGVAEIMSSISSTQVDTEYGDLGVFLARALTRELAARQIKYVIPEHPIRATVQGAGIHSLQLSGSTVEVSAEILPLRDIPIVRLNVAPSDNSAQGCEIPAGSGNFAPNSTDDSGQSPHIDAFLAMISSALKATDIDWCQTSVALSVPQIPRAGYRVIRDWSGLLTRAYMHFQAQGPLIVVCANDVAGALGLSLRTHLPGVPVICLDGIGDDGSGDYIDIGRPVAGGVAIPVVIKHLVFMPQCGEVRARGVPAHPKGP